MTAGTNSNYYQRGLELAKVGRYQEAFAYIKEHLRTAPDDAQALNDAGAILHCLGRSDEAINHLVQARNIQGDCAEIVWNLVEACLADGRASEAMQLFDNMERMGILNVDVLNRTANVFLKQDNKADAIEILLRSLQLAPDQEILRPMIDVIRNKRAKIAFFCGMAGKEKFLTEIYEFIKRRYQVQLFEGQSIDGFPNANKRLWEAEQMYELMKWSDISWFEGCSEMVVKASKLPKVCKNIVRLHRLGGTLFRDVLQNGNDEVYDNWPSHVQWENIDTLITVSNSFVKDDLLKQVPDIKNRTQLATIPIGVNLDKFKFVNRQRGKNLAYVGYLNMRKNPMFLLQCIQKLHYIDPEYKLFFAGAFQSSMLERYIRHMVQKLDLTDVVFFDGWQEDVNSWLQDKSYIVSGSIGENQGMGLLEGMACGLKPVVHNFPGASEIFPSEFLFNISEEFCEQILSDTYEPQRYRGFVEEHYSLVNQLSKINGIFAHLEAEINFQRATTSFGDKPQNENHKVSGLSSESTASAFENNGRDPILP